jgi:formate hydrogenlyase subunit 3/multisubunit Na+/H+ antiporter MnhD subunit
MKSGCIIGMLVLTRWSYGRGLLHANVQIRFVYFHFNCYFSRLFSLVLNLSLLCSASRGNRTPNRKYLLANHGNAKKEDAVLSGYIYLKKQAET